MRRSTDVFYFKQFGIRHDRCAHKVGTDSVLLGAWANCRDVRYALDIGSGSGVLSLMVAQRCEALVDGVEMDPESVAQARQNVKNTPWADRIRIFHQRIQEFESDVQYDLILSNPPYFVNSLKPPDGRRSNTRHTQSLDFTDLIAQVKRLLTRDGSFYLVLPPAEFNRFNEMASQSELYPFRQLHFRSKASKPVERVLAGFWQSPTPCVVEELVLYDQQNEWSEAYKALTRDYYLDL
ncbi:MAG: tRNA1(Val) (adenine(37)-N6)-methyltransferase [Cyclobacteriaceae bacterium]